MLLPVVNLTCSSYTAKVGAGPMSTNQTKDSNNLLQKKNIS